MPRISPARWDALVVVLVLGAVAAAPPSAAQDGRPSATSFFDAEEPLTLTLTANLRQLRRDRAEQVPWRAATLSYTGEDGDTVVVPLRVRTRGIFRLKHCEFPPLRFNFAAGAARQTVFRGLDKPKLVNYCRDSDRYEQYVLQELQLYRIYGLLTPLSHRVRLLRLTYVDSATGRAETTRYAFLMEEPEALARRVGGTLVEVKGAGPADLAPYHVALFGVFQYFIGNTDWSIAGLHNAELVRNSAFVHIPIPYDFDHAGAVNPPYATPSPLVRIKHVRERIYRGYCVPTEQYAAVFALFNEKKDEIYALYRDGLGSLLTPRVVDETLAYFDEFYRTINSPRDARRAIADACLDGQ
jgi:hypothetical protein